MHSVFLQIDYAWEPNFDPWKARPELNHILASFAARYYAKKISIWLNLKTSVDRFMLLQNLHTRRPWRKPLHANLSYWISCDLATIASHPTGESRYTASCTVQCTANFVATPCNSSLFRVVAPCCRHTERHLMRCSTEVFRLKKPRRSEAL